MSEGKGRQAVEVLQTIIGQPVDPQVAGDLIVRKQREFQVNQEYLSNVLAAVAFDNGRLLAAIDAADAVLDGVRYSCDPLYAVRPLLALPRAELVEKTATLQQPGRILRV